MTMRGLWEYNCKGERTLKAVGGWEDLLLWKYCKGERPLGELML